MSSNTIKTNMPMRDEIQDEWELNSEVIDTETVEEACFGEVFDPGISIW